MSEPPVNNEDPAKPLPPVKPLPTECCEIGCEVCVFDAYADALLAYEKALADWLRRHPD